MTLRIFTTGGTIDKIYFDQLSAFQIGESQIAEVLREANVTFPYEITPLMRKDSIDLTDDDREVIRHAVAEAPETRIVVTHGTDTMAETGRALKAVPDKTIVLTGAMQPVRFRETDAVFNIATAIAAARLLPPGVTLAMNGRLFDPDRKSVV